MILRLTLCLAAVGNALVGVAAFADGAAFEFVVGLFV